MDIKLKRPLFIAVIAVLICFLLVGGVTYAWFTNNANVDTNKVTARTADTNITLLVSSKGGAEFDGSDECELVQVNEQDTEVLYPVSTADLVHFVTQVSAGNYGLLLDESLYYHGRIFVKAESSSASAGQKISIYWDDIENMIVADEDSQLLNAGRLGLKFENNDPVILHLSDDANKDDGQVYNTYIGDTLQGDNIVISGYGESAAAVADPSISVKDVWAQTDGAKALAVLDINTIYQLDVYFYLEGCDPDCSDAVQLNGCTIGISLYGVLSE